MNEKLKKVYYCDYCKKHGLSKHKMAYHEKICGQNPKNGRPCFSCEYFTKIDKIIIGYYYDGSESERPVSVFYCTKKDICLHTPKNEVRNNAFDFGDVLNEPMPKECEEYK